jgi:hypothetical protein
MDTESLGSVMSAMMDPVMMHVRTWGRVFCCWCYMARGRMRRMVAALALAIQEAYQGIHDVQGVVSVVLSAVAEDETSKMA